MIFEDKCASVEIKRRIAAMDGCMVIRAEEHQVLKIVGAASAEPMDMMRMT